MKLLGELFTEDLIDIFTMHELQGKQSYLKFLHYFLNESKLAFYEKWNTDEDIPPYHDIPMPANFVNFVVTQYREGSNEDTLQEQGMEKGLNDLNEALQEKSAKYQVVAPAAPTDVVLASGADADESDEGGNDQNGDKMKKRDWMIRIIEVKCHDDNMPRMLETFLKKM